MRFVILPCVWLIFTLPFFATANELTTSQIREGWISLFDGETLFGWEPTSEANWRVEQGAIHVDHGEAGWLMTNTQFADYELYVEFKADNETNSGVFLRTSLSPEDPLTDCYEVNIAPQDDPFPTGSIVGHEKRAIESDAEDWQTLEITASGPSIKVVLNGQEVCNIEDSQPILRGHIGLQFREGAVAFRNLRLKPLGLESIFNGEDLTGWNTDRTGESEFFVNDEGELQVTNGPGQLESEESYGDFVLQVECFVNGEELNSGVFFRCIPRDMMMGYESQIHNGMIDDDPTRPVDCGTGGIFRRQDARKIVANDFEWFTKTIVTNGPHMSVWVNGFQVSDWTDEREPDENPRRGLRLEPGTLAIQGHDPTTDLRFRNFRILETPER